MPLPSGGFSAYDHNIHQYPWTKTLSGDVNIRSSTIQIDSILKLKLAYAAELLYYTVQGCLKFSVLAFYWRLFTSTNLRHWISSFTILVTIWTFSAVYTST